MDAHLHYVKPSFGSLILVLHFRLPPQSKETEGFHPLYVLGLVSVTHVTC